MKYFPGGIGGLELLMILLEHYSLFILVFPLYDL